MKIVEGGSVRNLREGLEDEITEEEEEVRGAGDVAAQDKNSEFGNVYIIFSFLPGNLLKS